jgi:hypothetical protein
MKRISFFIVLGLLAPGLFAQAGNNPTPGGPAADPLPPVTVSGNLAFINARIGLTSGETTYYVPGIDRLIGFVDGLKEGAPVTLEGYAFPVPTKAEYRYLRVFKLSFNGKDYQLRPRAEGTEGPGPFTRPEFKARPGPGGPRHHFRGLR